MFISALYVILAILGLSFLIFIHELGHYWMARRVGMRVETFSIGFGRPIYSWMRDGVKWQIGWLLFGGYVKIAGVDLDGEKDPYQIPDGFFGRPPLDRIKVALAGPVTNIVFALFAFAILWLSGGREKNFSEFTHVIGWVDPSSELYKKGLRPGDEITAYNDQSFRGSKDHIYMPMTSSNKIKVEGNKIDYATGQKFPYSFEVKPYPHPAALEKGIMTSGVINSANYIIYNTMPGGAENPLPANSPLQESGIEYGDRIVWANGELIFSIQQLNHILSGNKALLTIQRGSETILRRVPRIRMQELKPDPVFKEEIIDWQFAAKLNNIKTQNLFTIPYNLTNDNIVENELRFIDKEKQEEAFPEHAFSDLDAALEPGDKIIAVNGMPIQLAYELLSQLQNFKLNIIVERDADAIKKVPYQHADADFQHQVEGNQLKDIIQSIGTTQQVDQKGNFYLLKPIAPKLISELSLSSDVQAQMKSELIAQKKEIDSIEDPEKRHQAQRLFEQQEKRLILGLPNIQDRRVNYNPEPFALFTNVFDEIFHTLRALFTGSFNPKWMSGPIGIVQIVHDTSMSSIREALYWLGAISLNLGMLNLLPIPVLDGGTILMSLFELVTRKKTHPKTLEKVVIPFAVLLIAFFIFLTYNDLMRLFHF